MFSEINCFTMLCLNSSRFYLCFFPSGLHFLERHLCLISFTRLFSLKCLCFLVFIPSLLWPAQQIKHIYLRFTVSDVHPGLEMWFYFFSFNDIFLGYSANLVSLLLLFYYKFDCNEMKISYLRYCQLRENLGANCDIGVLNRTFHPFE